MAETSGHGRFVWFDLFSSDPDHSADFYKSVLGWKTQPMQGHAETDMWLVKGNGIGSVTKLAEGGSTESHWLPYIAVVDIEATLAHARDLGGEVLLAATPTGTGGTYAVLKDPQGAAVGVYGPARGDQKLIQEVAWLELSTTDYDAAFRFYRELFGWEHLRSTDMGPMGTYLVFGYEGAQRGGIFAPPAGTGFKKPQWLVYANVKDVNEAARRIGDAGGKVLSGPMEIPGGDWIVQFVDPTGAAMAAFSTKASMAAAPPAPAKPSAAAEQVEKVVRKVADVAEKVKTSIQNAATRTAAAVKSATQSVPSAKPKDSAKPKVGAKPKASPKPQASVKPKVSAKPKAKVKPKATAKPAKKAASQPKRKSAPQPKAKAKARKKLPMRARKPAKRVARRSPVRAKAKKTARKTGRRR